MDINFMKRKTNEFPLFLRIYASVLLTIIMFILDILKNIIIFGIGVPFAIIGVLIYMLIVRPIKWICGFFITIDEVDIYE